MDMNHQYQHPKYSINSSDTACSGNVSGQNSPRQRLPSFTQPTVNPYSLFRPHSNSKEAQFSTYIQPGPIPVSYLNNTNRGYQLEIDGKRYHPSQTDFSVHKLSGFRPPKMMSQSQYPESYISPSFHHGNYMHPSYISPQAYNSMIHARHSPIFSTPNKSPILAKSNFKKPEPKLKNSGDTEIKPLTLLFMKLDRAKKPAAAKMRKELVFKLRQAGLDKIVLKNLEPVLLKFLMSEKIDNSEIRNLRVCERILLAAYLVKKKYLDVDTLQMTAESINWFEKRATVKRNEQEYKIILKKAFRALISQFNQTQLKFDGDKTHFYQHHLGDFAKANDLELSSLYLEALFNEKGSKAPSKRKSKKNYAQILRTSPSLMQDIKMYLDNRFQLGTRATGSRRDAEKEIKRKVPDLLNKWKSQLFTQETSAAEQMADFLIKFFTNKKVKLPWSVNEVERAVSAVKNLLQM